VGVNGSNRILSHGAPLSRVMPNGCLGSPVIVLLLVLTEASSWMSDPERASPPRLDNEHRDQPAERRLHGLVPDSRAPRAHLAHHLQAAQAPAHHRPILRRRPLAAPGASPRPTRRSRTLLGR